MSNALNNSSLGVLHALPDSRGNDRMLNDFAWRRVVERVEMARLDCVVVDAFEVLDGVVHRLRKS